MKLQQVTTIITLLVIAGGNGGCGGGSEGTGAFTSSFAKTAPIGSLSIKDRQKLCQQFADFSKSLFTPELLCPLGGAIAGFEARQEDPNVSGEAVCQEKVPLCIDKLKTDGVDAPSLDCPINDSDLTSCKLPIGVLEDCINNIFDEFRAGLESITCDQADKIKSTDDLEPDLEGAKHSAACQRLATECPGDAVTTN